jgi:hypothetical protein
LIAQKTFNEVHWLGDFDAATTASGKSIRRIPANTGLQAAAFPDYKGDLQSVRRWMPGKL